jgi:hypothetical protein
MSTALAPVRGFLTGAVTGVTLSAFVTGIVIESVPVVLTGLGLPLGYGVLRYLAGMPRRAREAAVVPRVALAKVESLRAGGTETGDVPVDFVLTVAPDDAPAHRVTITHSVNLIDLPRHRAGDVLVVEYPPDRPWQARIVTDPAPQWRRRVDGAVLGSAPGSTLVRPPPEGGAFAVAVLLGLLLGAVAVLALYRVELFAPDPPAEPEPSTVTSSSGSATITVGPEQSFLAAGELRRAIETLAGHADVSRVLTAAVQERLVSVVFAPSAAAAVPHFDLREVPLDRIPDLVRRATSTLDVGSPKSWQVTVVPLPGAPAVRVTVTGPGGSASLALPPR